MILSMKVSNLEYRTVNPFISRLKSVVELDKLVLDGGRPCGKLDMVSKLDSTKVVIQSKRFVEPPILSLGCGVKDSVLNIFLSVYQGCHPSLARRPSDREPCKTIHASPILQHKTPD